MSNRSYNQNEAHIPQNTGYQLQNIDNNGQITLGNNIN